MLPILAAGALATSLAASAAAQSQNAPDPSELAGRARQIVTEQSQETSDPSELVKRARRLVTDGRVDDGIALYERAMKLAPTSFEAHLGAGLAYDLQLAFPKARATLSRALELAADDQTRIQALNALAVSFAFEGNAQEAAGFYQKVYDTQVAASNFGAAAGTANALGRVYLETGDVANARRWYETGYEAARRQPASPGAQLRLWEFRWLHAQGRIAARAGRAEEASKHVADARALITQHAELKEELPTWHYLAGYVALAAKDYQSAIQNLQMADERDPFVLALLAQAYEGHKNAARAREVWKQAAASTAHNLQNAFARPLALKRLQQK